MRHRLLKFLVSTITLLLLATVTACRKRDMNYAVEGCVTNARHNHGLHGATVTMEQQVLSNGMFNSNFQVAATGATGSNGLYRLEWKKENVVLFKLSASMAGYFGRSIELNPDLFDPGETLSRNFALFPEAAVEVHIVNEPPGLSTDQLAFRFDDADFDCNCCNNTWRYYNGAAIDTLIQCKLYGDQYLKYLRHIQTGLLDTLILDSIWCPAFQTTGLEVLY